MTMLGDIHKQQSLNEKGNIAYSGSLIQQNFGDRRENNNQSEEIIKQGRPAIIFLASRRTLFGDFLLCFSAKLRS